MRHRPNPTVRRCRWLIWRVPPRSLPVQLRWSSCCRGQRTRNVPWPLMLRTPWRETLRIIIGQPCCLGMWCPQEDHCLLWWNYIQRPKAKGRGRSCQRIWTRLRTGYYQRPLTIWKFRCTISLRRSNSMPIMMRLKDIIILIMIMIMTNKLTKVNGYQL